MANHKLNGDPAIPVPGDICSGDFDDTQPIIDGCLDNGVPETPSSSAENGWGFALHDLYKLATTFQKEKEGKALRLSYGEKLKLVALSQQVSHGPYDDVAAKPVGYLDVIGKDRRQAWKAIGNLSREQAMEEFVDILNKACPLFNAHVEAHQRDLEEKERLAKEREENIRREEEARLERKLEEEARRREEHEQRRTEMQRQQIQDALNQQTFFQFKAYAEQQFPGDPEQQAILIKQLQEQHYQQYIQQVYQQQAAQTFQRQESRVTEPVHDDESQTGAPEEATNSSESGEEPETEWTSPVKPASMWTRKDIADFKSSLHKEGGDSIIKVGHGETVTVRVPTHEDGTCLFWEFATDSYDIGFGVYFEWTKTPGTSVSVHISESEDDASEDDGAHQSNGGDDVERGLPADEAEKGLAADKLPMTVIIPIYRRDCHEEVYAGSHVYPGQGVYLLKFDNSYSLWRSKTLYYRVYYTH